MPVSPSDRRSYRTGPSRGAQPRPFKGERKGGREGTTPRRDINLDPKCPRNYYTKTGRDIASLTSSGLGFFRFEFRINGKNIYGGGGLELTREKCGPRPHVAAPLASFGDDFFGCRCECSLCGCSMGVLCCLDFLVGSFLCWFSFEIFNYVNYRVLWKNFNSVCRNYHYKSKPLILYLFVSNS